MQLKKWECHAVATMGSQLAGPNMPVEAQHFGLKLLQHLVPIHGHGASLPAPHMHSCLSCQAISLSMLKIRQGRSLEAYLLYVGHASVARILLRRPATAGHHDFQPVQKHRGGPGQLGSQKQGVSADVPHRQAHGPDLLGAAPARAAALCTGRTKPS